jgi:hypothetical protein
MGSGTGAGAALVELLNRAEQAYSGFVNVVIWLLHWTGIEPDSGLRQTFRYLRPRPQQPLVRSETQHRCPAPETFQDDTFRRG